MPEVIRQLAGKMDYVILDTPPCGMFQDAALMEAYVDAVLYVVKYDAVPQQKIMESLSFLKGSGTRFLGYVFNSCPQGANDYGMEDMGTAGTDMAAMAMLPTGGMAQIRGRKPAGQPGDGGGSRTGMKRYCEGREP